MVEALITPALIRWARQRSGAPVNEAAQKISVTPETLDAWERGLARPSFIQALELARRFNVPFGYLYLAEPPDEQLPLPDLRTVNKAAPLKPSPEFLEVLYDSLRKQDWYREYLQADEADPVEFVGRFNGDPPEAVAADIRTTLGIDQRLRQNAGTWEEFLVQLVRKAEDARILVLRSSYAGSNTRRSLNVQEFRGFAISDPIAPLIFINSADAKAAQIFTLAHELAHLWVGATGVSNPDYLGRSQDQRHATDRHCDAIAAEVLVPKNDLLMVWNPSRSLDQNISDLVRRYRVSTFVILRRAFDLDQIDTNTYREKYDELMTETMKKKGATGNTFYKTFLVRNSRTFTTTLVLAAAEGRVSPTEAASLLNVRLGTMPKVQHYILTGLENA